MNHTSLAYRLDSSGNQYLPHLTERSIPDLKPTEVLVRVAAISLNYRDLLVRADPRPNKEGLIPFSDCAGVVEEVGESVLRWRSGDKVCAAFFPDWRDGRFSKEKGLRGLGGGQTDGVAAENIVVDESALVRVPNYLTLAEAATLPCAAVTAWHALFERGDLAPGQTVLVQGTGGVALFGLQLAVAHGARVIVLSSSDEKLAKTKALGAWETINYRECSQWESRVLEITDGHGVDQILEIGGQETIAKSIDAVAMGGSIAQIGVLTGFAPAPNLLPLQLKNASIHGICVGSIEHFEKMSGFIDCHQIKPAIWHRLSFAELPEAYGRLSSPQSFGKLVVDLRQER